MWRMYKKELKELLNIGAIISMLALATMYGLMGKGFEAASEVAQKSMEVVVVGNSEYINDIEGLNIIKASSVEEGLKIAREKKIGGVVVIPEGFDEKVQEGGTAELKVIWIVGGLGIFDMTPTKGVRQFLEKLKSVIIDKRISDLGASVDVLNPLALKNDTVVKDRWFKGKGPDELASMASQSLMMPVLIMMIIATAGGTMVNSMAMEKENKTLETLLTLPVRRMDIVIAKILASTTVGVVMAGIYFVGLYFYMSSLSEGAMKISLEQMLLPGISMLLSLLAGLSMCMILGILVRDQKSGGVIAFLVSTLAIVPMLISIFKDLDTLSLPLRVLVFAIPFTHPMYASRFVMLGMNSWVVWGMVYNAIIAAVLMFLSSKLFNSDVIILGKPLLKKKPQNQV